MKLSVLTDSGLSHLENSIASREESFVEFASILSHMGDVGVSSSGVPCRQNNKVLILAAQ